VKSRESRGGILMITRDSGKYKPRLWRLQLEGICCQATQEAAGLFQNDLQLGVIDRGHGHI